MTPGGITPREQLVLLNMLQVARLRPGLAVKVREVAPAELEVACQVRRIPVIEKDQGIGIFGPETGLTWQGTRMIPPLTTGARARSGLVAALEQRIPRRRAAAESLSAAQRKLLDAALARRYGEAEAGGVGVLGVYPDIPPEAAQSIRLSGDLAQASFVPESTAGEPQGGFWLVVAKSAAGKTDKFLLRLE